MTPPRLVDPLTDAAGIDGDSARHGQADVVAVEEDVSGGVALQLPATTQDCDIDDVAGEGGGNTSSLGNISEENAGGTAKPSSRPLAVDDGSPESGVDFFNRNPKLLGDFRLFLIVLWRFLGLPDPTALQLSMAYWFQHGPARSITMAFRGAAKSWIAAGYVLWRLYVNPQRKILVVSGSLKRAVAFTQFCLTVIRGWVELAFLRPRPDQRQSSQAFDVGPATPDQNPSFHAAGVTSQTVGFRADEIVPDDVETNTNSLTVLMREKVRDAVKEFDSILKPGGAIKFLGTPHDFDSLYNHLRKVGFKARVWPGRFPDAKQRKGYGEVLAPYIAHQLTLDPALVGKSTEPGRFTDEDLARRELSIGKTEFGLQFMCDTSLADAGRYPLRLSDLMVLALEQHRGPEAVAWGKSDELVIRGLPLLGFDGDHLHRPASVSGFYQTFSRVVGFVDPSGQGDDETSLSIAGEINGIVYLMCVRGWRDGHSEATMKAIARLLVKWGAHEVVIETNYGGAMFGQLLRPHLEAAWQEVNAKKNDLDGYGGAEIFEQRTGLLQKEKRILGVLEPVTQGHRLVVNLEVIEQDYQSVVARGPEDESEEGRHRRSMFYQYTHITRERESLHFDDRLDSVAGCLAQFAEELGVNPAGMSERKEQERMEEELEALFAEADEIGGHTPKQVDNRMGVRRPANIVPHRSSR